jgi:YesN/AraC family two-component response regulator
MDASIFRSKSIAELLQSMGLGKPAHPLIAIIDASKLSLSEDLVGMRFCTDMYCIALKDAGCGIDYGRHHYDFTEGALLFTAPDQVMTVTKAQELNSSQGWMLYFHPDLIRNTSFGAKIDQYSFFNYEVHEALYLSEEEEEILNQVVQLINNELNARIDSHSQQVLVSNIELMLNYSVRFYERQMHTRAAQNSDVVSKVESVLKAYYQNNKLIEVGQPTIQYLADHCNLSPSYLSDVLTKETGRSAKEHINDFLVNKGKHLLLSTTDSIGQIAYSLGFNYPHYFGRMFKQKTGKTPQEYRQVN